MKWVFHRLAVNCPLPYTPQDEDHIPAPWLFLGSSLATLAKLFRPGGTKTVLAENLLLNRQLVIPMRSRKRAPHLSAADRVFMAVRALFLNSRRMTKVSVCFRPSTLVKFHQCLVRQKYQMLFSSQRRTKPGPKGPFEALIRAIVELKRRNPRFGCPRIALIISTTFGITVDKHLERRILIQHAAPESNGVEPFRLTFFGQMKIACGASICSAVNPSRSEAIGCSS